MSSDSTRQQLQQAYEFIRSGRKSEAEAILLPILKANEDDANAWWLLANAVTSPDDIREALQNVLRLRPGQRRNGERGDERDARAAHHFWPPSFEVAMRVDSIIATVRFASVKVAPATRRTSAALTFWMRSTSWKSPRQSP